VRDDGIIQSQAVLIAIGINWAGKRQVLGVELATARVNRAGGSFCWRSNSAA
jgi:transposase-like protein